jgi:hypothetical protein
MERVMRVDWVLLDDAGQRDVAVGDLVSVEAGGAPTWRVLKLTDGRAWLRDDARRMDQIAPLNQFHWKAHVRG